MMLDRLFSPPHVHTLLTTAVDAATAVGGGGGDDGEKRKEKKKKRERGRGREDRIDGQACDRR